MNGRLKITGDKNDYLSPISKRGIAGVGFSIGYVKLGTKLTCIYIKAFKAQNELIHYHVCLYCVL